MEMRLTTLILCFSIFCGSLHAQYVSRDGNVIRSKIIGDLRNYPVGSEDQEHLRREILECLVEARKNHSELVNSKEKMNEVKFTIMELGNMRGDFQFLNPQQGTEERIRNNDTLSSDIQMLEQRLDRFQDSLRLTYDSFKKIIESKDETRASKERATFLLARSNDLVDIEYLFKNDAKFQYGKMSEESRLHWDSDADSEWLLSMRTGMLALYQSKFIEEKSRSPEMTNWILLPFFMEYWGDPNWELDNTHIEFIMLNNSIMRDYNEPWHLIRFIKANAIDSDTQIMEMIEGCNFDDKKYRK